MTIDMTWEAREKIIRRDERAEGREEGRQEQLLELVREGLLQVSDTAKKAGITEEEFRKRL